MVEIFKRQYYLSSVGEWYNFFDSKYSEWLFGRIEVYKNDEPYSIDELRYCLPPNKKWIFTIFDTLFIFKNLNYIEFVIIKQLAKILNQPPK